MLFPVAQGLEFAADLGAAGTVGRPVSAPPAVRVVDGSGNPVPGIPVTFEIVEGGGEVDGSPVSSGEDGVATAEAWVLGTAPGTNRVRAFVAAFPDLGNVLFEVEAELGPPAGLEAISASRQEAEVRSAVPEPPAVRVTDHVGNPLPDVEVLFEPEDGAGSVQRSPAFTDEAGVTGAQSWTLGPTAGTQTLATRIPGEAGEGVKPVAFAAVALAGPPASFEPASTQVQEARAGSEVADPPAILIRDEYENPVADVAVHFQVTEGGGQIEGSRAFTDEEGVAVLESWTLGTQPGLNRTRTLVEDLPELGEIFFEAEALPPTTVLTVTNVHLNQGSQRADGTVGGVAGRPGLLRIIAEANEKNDLRSEILVRLSVNGSVVREERLPPPGDSIPVNPDLNDPRHTWDLVLDDSAVNAGLAVEVILDPDSLLPVAHREGHRYPTEGEAASLDVQPIRTFRLVFFPIHWTTRDLTGDINAGNLGEFLGPTRQWIATDEISTEIRTPLSTDRDLTELSGWSDLLSDLLAVRTAEGATDEYYHGIVPDFEGRPAGGIAHAPGRNGLTHDGLPPAAATLAHELGHNLGRDHTSCGEIGVPGYDILNGELRHSGEYSDFMSYCRPWWTSDSTYKAILEWRREEWREAAPVADQVAASEFGNGSASSAGLLVWGRIGSRGAVLEPAFALTAQPALPEHDGPYALWGVGADGRELFQLSFQGELVADGVDPDERHFAFFVPLGGADLEALSRIELTGPGVNEEQVSSPRAAAPPGDPAILVPDPAVRLDQVGPAQVRIRWAAESYPRALVRDRETGRVMAIGGTGELQLSAPGVPLNRLEVLVSDGAATLAVSREPGSGRWSSSHPFLRLPF